MSTGVFPPSSGFSSLSPQQSRFFPNFNFNKIALIIKRDCSYTDDDGERFFDSEVGEYISEVKNMYGIETQFVIFTADED